MLPDENAPYRGAGLRKESLLGLAAALLVYYVALRWLTPAIARLLEPRFPSEPGPRLFLQHLLTFSWPTAMVCGAAWWLLSRLGVLEPPRSWLGFGPRPGQAIRCGLIAGVILSAVVVVVGLALGQRLRFHPNAWGMAGNVFSNAYEELEYRGLLLHAGWAASGHRWGGVLISSLVFGWSHAHGSHAVPRMIAAGIAGLVFALLAVRTRSLGGAWTAHQLSDMILDSI